MSELKEFAIPLFIAFTSALITAYFSLKLKFASSEKEALLGLVNFGKTVITGLFAIWLLYDLISRGFSSEPISRIEILLMILDAFTLVLIMGYLVATRMVQVLEKSIDVTMKHVETTNRIIEFQENTKEELKELKGAASK